MISLHHLNMIQCKEVSIGVLMLNPTKIQLHKNKVELLQSKPC